MLFRSKTKASRKSGKNDTESWEGVDRELFEHLRDLRRELASEQGVPAYIVMGDATLRDLARRRPASLENLLEVHGIGQKKCDDYGQQVLELIADYCAANEVSQDVGTEAKGNSKPKRQRTDGPTASAIAAFPHFQQGCSIAETAKLLGRAESTVRGYLDHYLRHNGVTDPTPWVEPETASRVREALLTVGGTRLRPVFDHLDGEVSYELIRIVATCMANANGE